MQLWAYSEQDDKVSWQVEFRWQDDLGNGSHVQAMRQWLEAGAPLAFIAKLTGNGVDRVEAIVRPVVDVQAMQAKPQVQR